MTKFSLLSILALAVLIYSCSEDTKNRSSSEYLSAYLNENTNVVLFGKIMAKDILVKAEYEKIPKAAVLIKSELEQYEAALDLSQGVCFAMEGPFEKDGTPSKVIAFVKVKNQDSLTSKVASLGLMLSVDGDMEFVQEDDVSIGIKENLAIFISKKGKYDGKASIKEAFEKTEKDLSEGKVKQILDAKSDILIGVNFSNLYKTSNTSLSNLSDVKKKELESLVDDSYLQSTISFDEGQAVFETKNMFSDALAKRMFFKSDNTGSIASKLGVGNPKLGLSLNADMSKLENFLDDFAPDLKKNITKMNFQMQLAMVTLGNKPLTNLLSGELGMLMVGDMMRDGSLVPEANIFLGFGAKGKDVKELLNSFLPKGNDMYGMKLNVNDKGISLVSTKVSANKLTIPQFAADFGKSGFTAFVNFDGMDMKSFDLKDGAKAIYALQNIWINVNNDGSKMIVKGKNPKGNILKQVIDVYVSDLKAKIGELN